MPTTVASAAALLPFLAPAAPLQGDGGPIEDPIPGPIPASEVHVRLETAASGLIAPNKGVVASRDPAAAAIGLDRLLFVTDQVGVLHALDLDTGATTVFLDVTDQLVELGIAGPGSFDERGLLGVAFHPDYLENGKLYTYQSEPESAPPDFTTMPPGKAPDHQSVVAEWVVPDPASVPDGGDPSTLVDPASKRVLLRIDQPQFNHDGGDLAFGPDGMLYFALGDGGAADDQGVGHVEGGNGQEPGNPLGSILRIDPDGTDSANGEYGIPPDNPFVGMEGFVEETFAFGFRNPFRFSFDLSGPAGPGTGQLFAADVGQNDIEEIDIVVSGGNYGWRLREGSFWFDPNGDDPGFVTETPPPDPPDDLIDPIAEYDHDEGTAIIGGFVYRGVEIPSLTGRYVFGELAHPATGKGRLFHLGPGNEIRELALIGQEGFELQLFGFGRDFDGELYALGNATGVPFPGSKGEPTGEVLRIAPNPSPFLDLGFGLPGSGGLEPVLQGSGSLVPGTPAAVLLSQAAPLSPVLLLAGLQPAEQPFAGGILVPFPSFLVVLTTGGAGTAVLEFQVPPSFRPGFFLYIQAAVLDGAAAGGFALSNALQGTVQFP